MGKIDKRESAGCDIVQQQADDEYEYAKKTIVADGAGGHGYEEDGKGKKFLRPVLVLRKLGEHTFIGLPLTTVNAVHKYVLRCDSEDCIFRQVILSQIKVIDYRRLQKLIGGRDWNGAKG